MQHPDYGAILRTPDERFEGLDNWPHEPSYIDTLPGYEGMRAHYVDLGPKDAEKTFFCLHGEPTWAYLFRFMIPEFLASGARVVALDMFGFGRSDKPVDDDVYTYHFHRNMVLRFLEHMQLENVTLVCQDWGGIIGLTLPMEMPESFTRLIVMNTGLPTGQVPSEGFKQWREFVKSNPEFEVRGLMQRSTPKMTDGEADAYGAPFPSPEYMGGVRQFPQLVMTDPGMDGIEESKRAIQFWSSEWSGDSFMAIGMQDPVLGAPVMRHMAKMIEGCPEPLEISEAGHFVQEWGEQVAKAALAHFGDT